MTLTDWWQGEYRTICSQNEEGRYLHYVVQNFHLKHFNWSDINFYNLFGSLSDNWFLLLSGKKIALIYLHNMHFFAPGIPTQRWIKSKLIRNSLFCVRLDLLHIFYAFTGFQLHLVLFQFEVDMLYLNWHFQTGDNISPSGLRASVVQGDDDTLLQPTLIIVRRCFRSLHWAAVKWRETPIH